MEYRNVTGIALLIKEEIIQKGIMFDKIHVARNTVFFNPSENYLNIPRRRSWGNGPKILYFYARWRFVVSFTLRPHLFWKTVARTPWIVGKKRARTTLVEKRKLLPPSGSETRSFSSVLSLCRPHYLRWAKNLSYCFVKDLQKEYKQYYSFRQQSVKLSSVCSWRTSEILSSVRLGR